MPVYALAVGKDGPKLQASADGSCVVQNMDRPIEPLSPGQTRLPLCGLPLDNGSDFRRATMEELCTFLSLKTDRKVVDRTGIKGMFDIRLGSSGGYLPGHFRLRLRRLVVRANKHHRHRATVRWRHLTPAK